MITIRLYVEEFYGELLNNNQDKENFLNGQEDDVLRKYGKNGTLLDSTDGKKAMKKRLLKNKAREVVEKMTDQEKIQYFRGDRTKLDKYLDIFPDLNCKEGKEAIREQILNTEHNLEILINGLNLRNRKSIIKKLRKKKWNIINSGRDKTISLDSSVADAFEKGRYGLTGYQPDIENLSILLEACQEIASKEQNIMQQSQSRSSGTTVTATSIALADNIRGLTTTLVSKCRELLRNISKEIKGKEK